MLVSAILTEAGNRGDFFSAIKNPESSDASKEIKVDIKTLYFGGGTPSLLTLTQLDQIVRGLERIFGFVLEKGANEKTEAIEAIEATIEVNPDDITREYLIGLKEIGFNRLSMGFQSFNDDRLKWMNRRHTASKSIESYNLARSCGFNNISTDLIFGYKQLTIKDWQEEVETLIKLNPEHISAYQLSIEPRTKLGIDYRKGRYSPPSDAESLRQYEYLRKRLMDAGYEHYEISNFAKPGKRSGHNSSYWEGVSYLGLGPAAHSFDGYYRYRNLPDLKRYISYYSETLLGCEQSKNGGVLKREKLSSRDRFNEQIMISLRRSSGLKPENLQMISKRYYKEFLTASETLLKHGDLIKDGKTIKIPPEKLFVSDGIIRDLFV